MDSSGCMYMTRPLFTVDGCGGVTAGLTTQSKTLHLSHFTLSADGVQGSGLSLSSFEVVPLHPKASYHTLIPPAAKPKSPD